MLKRPFLMALGLLAVIATPVLAAGLWWGLPLVGGAAVCSSTSTGVSGQVCNTTIPAGPSIVTGSETIPADTNLTQGRAPQTVRLPMAALNALPWTYSALVPSAASFTLTSASVDGGVIVTSGAALTPIVAVILPPSPIDGQQYGISANQTLGTLSVLGSGSASVSNAPTVLTATTSGGPMGYLFRYRSSNTTWYRLQ